MIPFLIPLAVSVLVGGTLLYFHVDGLIVGLAGLITFVGTLVWEFLEYDRWQKRHIPRI